MKHPETDLSEKPSLDAGRKTAGPKENLGKQAWTGNQMHISAETEDQTRDTLVECKGR